MRFSHVSCAVALALFGVTGAWAAEETAADKNPPLRAEAVIVLHGFATCIAGRRADEARALLGTDFGTEEYSEKIRALALTSGCLNDGRLKFANVLLAGGIAERLYKMDYGSRDIATVIPSDWTAAPIAARSEVEEVALCVVQRDPSGVRAVLDTDATSNGEKEAFGALGQAITGCVKAGSTMRLNRPMLRSILALGLYRSANHFSAAGRTAAPKTGS